MNSLAAYSDGFLPSLLSVLALAAEEHRFGLEGFRPDGVVVAPSQTSCGAAPQFVDNGIGVTPLTA